MKNICRRCHTKAIISKGYGNARKKNSNIIYEGYGTIVDCLKCPKCGHSWIPDNKKDNMIDLRKIEKDIDEELALMVWLPRSFKYRFKDLLMALMKETSLLYLMYDNEEDFDYQKIADTLLHFTIEGKTVKDLSENDMKDMGIYWLKDEEIVPDEEILKLLK